LIFLIYTFFTFDKKKKTTANQTENPHPNMTKKRNKLGEHQKQPKAATCSK